jgi:hypothetical protein
MKKNQNRKRNNNTKLSNQKTAINENLNSLLFLGHFDAEYNLELTEQELIKLNIEDIEKLNDLNDLKFLVENQNLWNKIDISTSNDMLNCALFLSKVLGEPKIKIDYLTFEKPKFSIEEEDFKNIFLYVNKKFNLNLIPRPLKSDIECKFKLNLKCGDKIKNFEIGNGAIEEDYYEKEERDEDQLRKNDGEKKLNNNTNNNNNTNEEEKEENEETIFSKCHISKKYTFFLCKLEDTKDIEKIEDFIKFITDLKINKSTNICIIFNDTSEQFENDENMKNLNKIYLLTDTFLMDTNSALKCFNIHYKKFTNNKKNEKEMTEKDLVDYFSATICCGGALSILNSKISFFIDENFTKITIIEVPMNGKANVLNYEIRPFPKINHSNINSIDNYKKTLRENRDFFKAVYFGGFFSKFTTCKNKIKGNEIFYPSHLIGVEILKRILDLSVNNMKLPLNQKFYIVKLNQKEINEYLKQEQIAKKEGNFVLDCTNVNKSKMKYYVPLFDYNLHEYFATKSVQKDLLNKGFINSKGFVNYDPLYRAGMKDAIRKKKRSTSLNKEKEKILKQIKKNEENNRERILRSVSPTNKKLPTGDCYVIGKANKYGEKVKKFKIPEEGSKKKCDFCDKSNEQKKELIDKIKMKKKLNENNKK